MWLGREGKFFPSMIKVSSMEFLKSVHPRSSDGKLIRKKRIKHGVINEDKLNLAAIFKFIIYNFTSNPLRIISSKNYDG